MCLTAVGRQTEQIQGCSIPARWLWFEMREMMSGTGGVLVIDERRMRMRMGDADTLAKVVGGITTGALVVLLRELAQRRVFEIDDDGSIICREMLRASKRREAGRRNGRKGGNPALRRTAASPMQAGPTLFEVAGVDFVWEGIRKRRIRHAPDPLAQPVLISRVVDRRPSPKPPVDLSEFDCELEPDQRWVVPTPPVSAPANIATSSFLDWFGREAVRVEALPAHVLGVMSAEAVACVGDGRKYADAMLTAYGRPECEARAIRFFDFCKAKRYRPLLQLFSDRWTMLDGASTAAGKPVQVLTPAAQKMVDRILAFNAEQKRLKGIA